MNEIGTGNKMNQIDSASKAMNLTLHDQDAQDAPVRK